MSNTKSWLLFGNFVLSFSFFPTERTNDVFSFYLDTLILENLKYIFSFQYKI